MSRLISLGTIAGSLLALASVAGCDSATSATELNPEGPPMVRQILMTEVYSNAAGVFFSRDNALAFGTHPDPVFATDDGKVDTALAGPGQKMRVIVDELLVGNNLEEIACKGQVDDDAYSRVPLGTTPADIANCAGTQDILDARCKGQHAVCLNNTGADVVIPGQAAPIPVGGPIGILDSVPEPDGDGAADSTHLIDSAVHVICTGQAGDAITAPMDLAGSYWQPSGNQQVPANGGVSVLGPALVLVPRQGLPTRSRCSLSFADDVVDRDGNRLCAPANGEIDSGCATDGDTSLISFGTELLRFKGNTPANNSMMVPRLTAGTGNKYGFFSLSFNVFMNIDSLKNHVLVTEGGAPATSAYEIIQTTGATKYEFRFANPNAGGTATGFKPSTVYTVTVEPTVTDIFDQPLGPPAGTTAAVCGNGMIEQGETCDDSNVVDGDGCSAACLISFSFTTNA
ncbi:MAG: hypothetical protein K8W52_01895 [Deltaproteobacteria bacterium]|nr:hypothetical protein [Deltaproteobacteria bacterium]